MRITLEIAERVNKALATLLHAKRDIFVDDIPLVIKDDFMNGKPFSKRDGKFVVYYSDFLRYMTQ